MAYSPAHRNSTSVTNLAMPPLNPQAQRRMSLPPPPSALPEPVHGNRRPPSPLRNGFAVDPATGAFSDAGSVPSEDTQNDRQWGQRATSPTPSVTQLATNFAQRVGSLMSNVSGSRSPGLPTDEELAAQAERERERTRREAEWIMAREAEERRTVEERVMAMLQGPGSPDNLPPPPSRTRTMSNPPSPSNSQKDGGWWSLAKSKLTPTKDPLTPAQQVIQETKQRDKEIEKGKKKLDKLEKKRSKDGKDFQPAPQTPTTEKRFEEPAFMTQGLAPNRPANLAPPSTPPRVPVSTPPSLAPSPLRTSESEGMSPSRAPPPLYAQFNPQGALDVPGTLLTIVKRFEKLEKWTVGHTRALEERMDDVERWLVEKEKEREKEETHGNNNGNNSDGKVVHTALSEMREEMAELQGRIGELGREMAKMVTAPGNLASGPGRNGALGRAPSTSSSIAVRSISTHIVGSPPHSTPPRAQGTTSPPVTTPVASSNRLSRSRLPYPTGDYASPPESTFFGQPLSPTSSPPASLSQAANARQLNISGLPAPDSDAYSSGGTSPSGLPERRSPNIAPASPEELPAPSRPAWRQSSASPTPKKRYTVALGGPIMGADRERERERERRSATPSSHHSRSHSRDFGTAVFSSSPVSRSAALEDTSDQSGDDEEEWGAGEETIGKTSGRNISLAPPSSSPNGNGQTKRARPQSMYAPITSQAISAPAPVTPLNIRLRSRSTDRFGLGLSDAKSGAPVPPQTPTSGTGKFVDPLLIRRQSKDVSATAPKVMAGKKKVPVGELVAFFDQEK